MQSDRKKFGNLNIQKTNKKQKLGGLYHSQVRKPNQKNTNLKKQDLFGNPYQPEVEQFQDLQKITMNMYDVKPPNFNNEIVLDEPFHNQENQFYQISTKNIQMDCPFQNLKQPTLNFELQLDDQQHE